MTRLSALLRLLHVRTPWVVALCYALLLQVALAPVVRAHHDPVLPEAVAAVLCLADAGTGEHGPGTTGHADMSCCLAVSRGGLGGPALLPGAPVVLPTAPMRVARLLAPAEPPGAPSSVDLRARPARAPPPAFT